MTDRIHSLADRIALWSIAVTVILQLLFFSYNYGRLSERVDGVAARLQNVEAAILGSTRRVK
jgi:hypothetical protein